MEDPRNWKVEGKKKKPRLFLCMVEPSALWILRWCGVGSSLEIRTSEVSYDCNRQNQKAKSETNRVKLRE